jgi:hypothetical protein
LQIPLSFLVESFLGLICSQEVLPDEPLGQVVPLRWDQGKVLFAGWTGLGFWLQTMLADDVILLTIKTQFS